MSSIQLWTLFFVVLTFSIYFVIAYRSRVSDTEGFYVAGHGIPAVANGAALAADWMSAASFISMAGLIAFLGYDGLYYLLGWTGGFVLLALLLAPYLRKFGKYTVPDFFGDRYSDTARLVAALAAIFVSFTYVAGQMRGIGIVFSRFVGTNIVLGVIIGMAVVCFYAVLGGMKGITWVQVAQYTVLIIAYLIPAVAIAANISGVPIPQISFGNIMQDLDQLQNQLGFATYSQPFTTTTGIDVFLFTMSLMVGTAGLPHVIVRFYTARNVRAARYTAFWALLFIALLYTTAPAVGVFAKTNLIQTVAGASLDDLPEWVINWQETGLITIEDKNGNNTIEPNAAFDLEGEGEVAVDRDILVLANPEIAGLPEPVIGLVAAGGLAAALSTAAGLLIVISSSVAHDIYYKRINPGASEAQRLTFGRWAMVGAVIIAGFFGVNPPGFVSQTVAFAFGFAAASFFPPIVLGIFWKRANAAGAMSGLIVGLVTTAAYIIGVTWFGWTELENISRGSFGTIGMLLNFAVAIPVTLMTSPPPAHMQQLISDIRYPAAVRRDPRAARR